MALAIGFDVAPERAVEFFRGKGLARSFAWQDMLHAEHDRGFTIAKMLDLDLLADVKAHVERTISEGKTFAQFLEQLKPELVRRGWWGRAEMTDPVTGERREVQLGSVRRLRTIYDTNLRTAYSAGHWARIEENASQAPYVMYSAILDARTRAQHREWNGKVLRHDDPWWKTHTPPNGWNCRCTVIQLSDRDLRKLGKAGPDAAPPSATREWINPRTGEVVQVPVGVDPGFGYAPGASVRESRAAESARLAMEKIAERPADLGAAAFAVLRPVILTRIETDFARFVDEAVSSGRAQRRRAIVGAIAPDELAYLAARGHAPQTAEIAVSDQLIVGAKSRRYAGRGVELSVAEWKALPAMLAGERQALYDAVEDTLLYVWAALTDPRVVRIVVRPDFYVRKELGALNDIRSAQKVTADNLAELIRSGRYVPVTQGVR